MRKAFLVKYRILYEHAAILLHSVENTNASANLEHFFL